ncbi:Uncharacterized protein APZ42_005762, partial [Daphnia magna]
AGHGRRRRLELEALPRPRHQVALPVRAGWQGADAHRGDRDAGRQDGRLSHRQADRALPVGDDPARLRRRRHPPPRFRGGRRQMEGSDRDGPLQVRRVEAQPIYRAGAVRRLPVAAGPPQRLCRRQEGRGGAGPLPGHPRPLGDQGGADGGLDRRVDR